MAECTSPVKTGMSTNVSKYILVVGSDTSNRVFTSLLLQKLEYHICAASNAEEALEMVNAILPTLIITDLKLSGMNAPQLMSALKQKPRTASIPVIIKTSQLTPQLAEKCREAGAVDCIREPVDPAELYRVVQAAIEPTPREHIRIPTRLSVSVNDTPLDLDAGEGATVLSSRGMYIRTQNPLPVKTKFPVRITLNGNNITAEAKVVYSHHFGEGPFGVPGMGLYFTEITQEAQDALQQYVNEEVTKGLAPGGA